MIKRIKLIVMLMLTIAMLPIPAICSYAAEGTSMTIDNIIAEGGSSVDTPIQLSNNTGICGATIVAKYDEGLTLTHIEKGDALSSLVMTKPGNYAANPVTVVWDGLEQDETNGTMATLTFTAPDKPGKYNISVLYQEGDIVDGDLNPVNAIVNQGQIEVISTESDKIIAENIGVFSADNGYVGESTVATAFKASLNGVNGKLSFTVTPENGEAHTFKSVTQITNTNVVLGIVVSGLADKNAVGEITVE